MIDLTNKPEGATHYDKSPTRYFKYSDNKKEMYYFTGGGWIKLSHWPRSGTVFKIPAWSIYNNTKPLSELSDEQVGAILRRGIEKGVIEVRDDNGKWYDNLILTGWNTALAYRAKQKSERELFIDDAIAYYGGDTVGNYTIDMLGAMFDAGFKAPKVGE